MTNFISVKMLSVADLFTNKTKFMKQFVIVVAFLALILSGCKKDDNNSNNSSGLIYSYYPTNVGHELIYDVTLITKDEFSGAEDTSVYQLREIIESKGYRVDHE